MNPKVDFFFDKTSQWQAEFQQLRNILLDCGMMEELKWGVPCYTYNNHNVVLMHGFKEYCALLFFKGALLQDPEGILVHQSENVQSPRQIRFTSVKEIVKLEKVLKVYVFEALEVEKAGLKLAPKKTSAYAVPEEFQKQLDKSKTLKKAFEALTPGRQRAYLLYFASAKLVKTREARVEKYKSQILAGKGLDD
ncbi:YdeI/OmpD-associated family protein [Flavihumibacter petaseus]|uniref:YdhG-like domain-containing protein n=1 Tax=Flavihumibacter petaseus NBRC 106054 TaxID=1220578 RepID=A0A0E9N2F4_9BACT|nr:DUF1801 domain-containing protein [Flavihumibacter petaseus]GAO43851.1 hypothetical protein FPE01S_02_09570 [Flavihumibacter petaseus NBRC 106054]